MSLIELLALADACRRAAAARITAILPYFGYARSDRRSSSRTPIAASLVARLIEAAGIDQVLTVDLHSPQIEGFFRIPLDTCSAVSALCAELADRLAPETVVVSPDTGRIAMAEEYARCLSGTVAVTHKRRESGRRTRVLSIAGEVKNRPCLIIDDMIATGETIANCAQALLDAGAQPGIAVAATHGLMLGDAWDRLESPALSTLLLSDTVPVAVPAPWRSRTVVASVACPLARSIERILCGEVVAEGDRPATA
jgi:ribose-phosphate pyrophosphokinase